MSKSEPVKHVEPLKRKAIVKVLYNGVYAGTVPTVGLHFKPGEVKEVPLATAEELILSGQFTIVKEVN